MVPGFDRLPALAAPLAQEWAECARRRRTDTVRMGELLLEFSRLGVLPDLTRQTVVEFGLRHGLSATEAGQIADVGVAVKALPAIKEDVRNGDVSVHAAGQLGRIAKEGVSTAALEGLRETSKSIPAEELKKVIDRKIEELRTASESVVAMTLYVPEETRKNFGRAREIASKKAGTFLTEGQTLTAVVEHYLGSFDPERMKPRVRRMPDTRGAPGRHFPAAVEREVRGRTGGRCCYPGCTNRIWVQLAHRVPHAAGGCREAWNAYGLCHYHHVRYDRSDFFIEGPTDAPVFYDAKRRRIWPNGRIDEHGPP